MEKSKLKYRCRYCTTISRERICKRCGKDSQINDDESVFRPFVRHHIEKTRNCMRCKLTFMSEWAGHRICPDCKEKEKRNLNI